MDSTASRRADGAGGSTCGRLTGFRLQLSVHIDMHTQSPDTCEEIEEIMLAGLRRMTPQEKLRRVWEMNRAVRALAAARLRTQYGPGLSEQEVKLRIASIRFDRATMIAAFGWDPEAG